MKQLEAEGRAAREPKPDAAPSPPAEDAPLVKVFGCAKGTPWGPLCGCSGCRAERQVAAVISAACPACCEPARSPG
jgi:hypothetical protein